MQRIVKLMVVLASMIIGTTAAYALPSYVTTFDSTYPAATSIGNCALCHVNPAGGGTRTAYGNAFLAAGHSFTAIESQASRCAGYTNIQLINLLISPGQGSCPAPAADTTPPTVTAFTVSATATSMMIPVTTFTATDNVGVTGYIITESATAPAATAAGWSATAPTTYTTMAAGAHTLYAYAKDAAGNVSAGVSASVTVTVATPTNRNIIWKNSTTGSVVVWNMTGTAMTGSGALPSAPGTGWNLVGTGNIMSATGNTDLIWRNSTTGSNVVWSMSGMNMMSSASLPIVADPAWNIVGVGDFAGTGNHDLVWRNSTTGSNVIWLMSGTTMTGSAALPLVSDPNWKIAGVGNFGGTGNHDIVWRNSTTGSNVIWLMSGTTISGSATLPLVSDSNWKIAGVGDFAGTGNHDIVWRNSATGSNVIWLMSGTTISGSATLPVADPSWNIIGIE